MLEFRSMQTDKIEIQDTPEISVIMGVYNGDAYLEKAIVSIQEQSFENWEFVICDDCSTDKTPSILKSFSDRDSRIKIITNDRNEGLGESLNRCIDLAKGFYIARQDADDFSCKERFERQLAYIKKNDVDVIGTGTYLIDNDDNSWGISPPSESCSNLNHWLWGTQIIHPTVLMKKSLFYDIGKYDPRAIRVEDYDLWLRMFKSGVRFKNMIEILYYYRRTINDYSRKKASDRVKEFKYRYRNYKQFNFPIISYLYLLKTILMIFIPKFLIYMLHRWRYQKFTGPVFK